MTELSRIHNPYINRKLGYYLVGHREFDSKIQACFFALEIGKPVQWVFNNEEFSKWDWKTEPQETLDQIYDRRARQLRERYDYIVLSYSGGSDSHNVLMSFYRQGLHIDEIITNTMTKASKQAMTVDLNNTDAYNAPEAEHQLQTIARLKEIATWMPKTKITITDCSDALFEELENAGDASWVLTKREGLNPAGMTRFNFLHFSEVRKQFDKDKKIAVVVGIEKPRTHIHRGELYMAFADRSANMITVNEHLREYPNSTVEFFYWTPDMPELLIKQGHAIKRWLEAFPENQELWNVRAVTNKMYRLVHDKMLRTILYTTWNPEWYQAKKAVYDWYSEFDGWFIDLYKDTRAGQVWLEGINYVKENLKPFLKSSQLEIINNQPVEFVDGLQVVSHTYNLGPIKNLKTDLLWIR